MLPVGPLEIRLRGSPARRAGRATVLGRHGRLRRRTAAADAGARRPPRQAGGVRRVPGRAVPGARRSPGCPVGAGPGGLAVTSGPDSQRGAAVLEAIRSRRVVRAMTAEPVEREALEILLDAARWAPTAGNRHLQRFVATDDLATLRMLRAVSPGMLQRPTAAITICTDRALAAG